ncbi:MAG: TolB protein [Abditibacteriota bacterium]|nr:TolB protein [Abditibacteriota bacterium]
MMMSYTFPAAPLRRRSKYFGTFVSILLVGLPALYSLPTSWHHPLLQPAMAATRPGAPRAFAFEWPGSNILGGPVAGDSPISISHGRLAMPSFRATNAGARRNTQMPSVVFTRQSNGTRNLWIATPSPAFLKPGSTGNTREGNTREGNAEKSSSLFDWTARGVVWSARPLTHLQAPFWIDEAWPLNDGKTLLCVTNAVPVVGQSAGSLAGNPRSQIARFDTSTGRFEALTNSASLSHSPSLSPDGTRFAFVSDRSGFDAVYVMPVSGGVAQIVATWARRPCWLNNQTLLFQNARGDQPGLFQVDLPRVHEARGEGGSRPLPRMLLADAVEATVSPDGQTVCAVLETLPQRQRSASGASAATTSRLVMMAADGSGARALPETVGARRPGFAPDGSAVLFDAPHSTHTGQSTLTADSPRSLWSLPLLRVAPVAVLQRVRPVAGSVGIASASNMLEILGTAFAAEVGPLRVRLEIGNGEAPTQWTTLATRTTPVQSARLALWQPPAPRGEWTLRLTVSDAAGDSSQSTLPVVLPLATGREAFILPPDFGPVDVTANTPPVPDNALGGPLAPNPVGPLTPPLTAQTEPPTRAPLAPPAPRVTTPQRSNTPVSVTPAPVSVPPVTTRPAATNARSMPPENAAPAPARSASPGRSTPAAPSNASNAVPARRSQNGASGGGTVPFLPLPALPPPPAPRPTPAMPEGFPAPGIRTQPAASASPSSPTSPITAAPQRPVAPAAPIMRAPEAGAAEPSPPPLPAFPPANMARGGNTTSPSAPQSTTVRRESQLEITEAPAVAATPGRAGDAARLQVIGAPASMAPGERATVNITLRNIGTTSWASAGGRPVRAFVRWIDERSGYRRRWSYQWLRSDVAPGGTSRLSFALTAPPQPGRYRLSFALVRLPQDGPSIAPPATNRDAQRRWPGEFGTVSFSIAVRGNASREDDER